MKKPIFILAISIAFFSLFSPHLYAISTIQINQAKIRVITPAGSAKSGEITIDNPTEDHKYVKAYLEDWYYESSGEGTKDFKPAGTTKLSAANWISFSPAEFTLPAFASRKINYTVRVPKDAVGGYYAVLFFETAAPPNQEAQEGVVISLAIRTACLFYVEPEGTIKRSGELSNLSVNKKSQDTPLEISLDFKNTGNVDITCSGKFNLIDKTGMVYARGEFNNVYTLPEDSGKLIATWKEPLTKGKYDLILSIDLGKALEELGIGRGPLITKEAEIEIGPNGEVLNVGALK